MATATLKAQLSPQKSDGTRVVRIRLIYKRESRYYRTALVALKDDLSPSGKIKNKRFQVQIDELLNVYRKKVNELDLDINDSDIDSIYRYLFEKPEKNTPYDFLEWAYDWCDKHKDQSGVQSTYYTAVNAFRKFKGEKVFVTEMTSKTMKAFEESLSGKKRAVSLYTSTIKALFNRMRDEYNDYDNDDIVIRDTMKSYNPPKQNVAEKRALSLEEIKKVFECPYDNISYKGMMSRHDLALDCYRLSFCLMGMNSADLFNVSEYDGEKICFNRTKTKSRRDDNATMEIDIQPYIRSLVGKYLDIENVTHNKRVKKSENRPIFNFHRRFGRFTDLNRAINIGLKEVGEELDIDCLQFYSARHTFATLAANDAGISPYLVNDMLCHVDKSLRITMLYIKKSFKPINDANRQFLEWFFSEIKKEGAPF